MESVEDADYHRRKSLWSSLTSSKPKRVLINNRRIFLESGTVRKSTFNTHGLVQKYMGFFSGR